MAKESKHTGSSFLVAAAEAATLAIRFLTNIALAWFLVPEDFGIAAIVSTVLVGGGLFSDIGIKDSVIRHEQGETEAFYLSAQSLQVIRGILLFLVLLAAAPFLADFYHVDILDECLMIAGSSFILRGLVSTKFYIYERNVDVIPGLVFHLLTALVVSIVIVVLAYFYRTVWVLMLSYPLGGLVEMLVSHYYARTNLNPFRMSLAYAREIISFGKWIFLSTLFTFVIVFSDKLFVGKLVDIGTVGLYHLAATLAAITFGVAISLSEKIVYPSIAEAARNKLENISGELDSVLRGFIPLVFSGMLLVFAISPLFFHYLYREDYAPAGYYAQIMVPMFWLMTVYAILNKTAIAFNRPRVAAQVSALTAAARVGLSLLGFYLFALNGFIFGLAAGSLLGSLVMLVWLRRSQGIRHTYLINMTVPLVVVIASWYAAAYFVEEKLIYYWVAAIAISVGVAIYLYVSYRRFIPIAMERLRMRRAQQAN